MELDINKIERALQTEKAEIDEMELHINNIRSSANALKETVQKYNSLKQEESDLRKLYRAKTHVFKVHTEFIQGITGEFPDGVFPLFSAENKTTATPKFAQLNGAEA